MPMSLFERTNRAQGSAPKRAFDLALRQARRLILFVLGSTVVLLGVVMLVTPGPAMVVIPLGLAILAIEFAWARRLLQRVRQHAKDTYKLIAREPHKSRQSDG